MSARERPADRGARRGQELLDALIHEFHEARMSSAVSQKKIGAAIGRSDAWVSWTESAANSKLSMIELSRMLACVGLDLAARL